MPGTPIPNTLSAVSWSDSACAQLQEITTEKQQRANRTNKVTVRKHSAARTAEEYACDLASVFRIQNSLSRGMSDNDVRGLNISVTKVLKKLRQERSLNLSLVKDHTFIDLVSCCPSILARSECPSSVAKGFLCNGVIDEKTKHWPDMKAMLRTCENIKLTKEKE